MKGIEALADAGVPDSDSAGPRLLLSSRSDPQEDLLADLGSG